MFEVGEQQRDSLFAIKVGLVLRSSGIHFHLADEVFHRCLADSSRFAALYELGVSKTLQGKPDQAVELFKTRIAEFGLSPRELMLVAYQYGRLRRICDAEAILERVMHEHPDETEGCLICRQAIDFVSRFDLNVALGLFEAAQQRLGTFHTTEDVEFEVRSALSCGKPLLFMRMGDGEASALRLSIDDTARYNLLYQDNLEEFSEFWFGTREVVRKSNFQIALQDLNKTIDEADLIGAYHPDGIRHEFTIGSRRGITWAVNVLRRLLEIHVKKGSSAKATRVGDPNIHYRMFADGTLGRIIASQHEVGVISCHSEFPEVLKAQFGIEKVRFFKTPGEKSNAPSLGAAAVEGSHWPERYFEIRSSIKAERFDGQLFLVAAGMLGKTYAADLKRSGAIVLDIGSVADAMMKRATRGFPRDVLDKAIELA